MLYIKLFIEREKNTGQSAPECPFKGTRYALQSPERSSMKSVHRGSLSNSRPYNTTVLYKCALDNAEYASHHRLDIGGLAYTRVLYFDCYFRHKDRGSTCMRIYVVINLPITTGTDSKWENDHFPSFCLLN